MQKIATMLVRFSVKNYRGFSKKIEFDLSSPCNYEFGTFAIKEGVIKNGIIYGPNGSGKTNFGLAMFDIVNHLSQKWKKPNYYTNFVYAGNQAAPVEFVYVFKFDKEQVTYSYSKNQQGALLSEKMTLGSRSVFSKKEDSVVISEKFFPNIDASVKKNLEGNANNISIINFLLSSVPLDENHFLIKLQRFVNSMLWFRCLDVREFIGLDTNIWGIDEYIIRHDLVDDFSKFISIVSSQRFSFVKPNANDKVLFCNIEKSRIAFHELASTGTDSLELLYFWMTKMKNASFVFIDEFDAFYHYRLSLEVCKRLFQYDCQLFLSSHNTSLMTNDLLRPDCNFLLNNNKILPLCKCTEKELRWGHNIEKLYKGGTFSL